MRCETYDVKCKWSTITNKQNALKQIELQIQTKIPSPVPKCREKRHPFSFRFSEEKDRAESGKSSRK